MNLPTKWGWVCQTQISTRSGSVWRGGPQASDWRFNLCPAYRGSGARVTYIASDWREVRVRLPLSWRSRNYVGIKNQYWNQYFWVDDNGNVFLTSKGDPTKTSGQWTVKQNAF